MTYLIATIVETTAADALAAIDQAFVEGADLVEVRIDALSPAETEFATLVGDLPVGRWIATCRSPEEGGVLPFSARNLAATLSQASEASAAWIDVERRLLEQRPELHGKLLTETNAGWICSEHFTDGPRSPHDSPYRIVLTDAIDKQAWCCQDLSDNVSALQELREAPGKRVRIPMGPRGIASRVLARKVGGFATFASLSDRVAGAPGQLTVSAMKNTYGWDRIDNATRVFGVLGWPVGHSLSPSLFNWYFGRDSVNAVYLPLPAETDSECATFIARCRDAKWLDVGGFSITIPHKQSVFQTFGDGADEDVRAIGAANTIHLSDSGLTLANTDVRAVRSILQGLPDDRIGTGRHAIVLGAGGVARSVVAALRGCGMAVTISNRSPARAGILAAEFGCQSVSWDERGRSDWDIAVNCTSVGMDPGVGKTPLPADQLRSGGVVFDTVYNPVRTRLLREASAAGCLVVDGVTMFVRQAAEQYRIWTGRSMDINAADQYVRSMLKTRSGSGGEGKHSGEGAP